jgi:hypothetical protein
MPNSCVHSCDITIESVAGTIRFPSVSRFVQDYVRGSPLSGHVAKVSDEIRGTLVSKVEDALMSYVADEGLRFPIKSAPCQREEASIVVADNLSNRHFHCRLRVRAEMAHKSTSPLNRPGLLSPRRRPRLQGRCQLTTAWATSGLTTPPPSAGRSLAAKGRNRWVWKAIQPLQAPQLSSW